jgi:hypothetical protein
MCSSSHLTGFSIYLLRVFNVVLRILLSVETFKQLVSIDSLSHISIVIIGHKDVFWNGSNRFIVWASHVIHVLSYFLIILVVLDLNRVVVISKIHKLHRVLPISPFDRWSFDIRMNKWIRLNLIIIWMLLVGLRYIYTLTLLPINLLLTYLLLSVLLMNWHILLVLLVLNHITMILKQVRIVTCYWDILSMT